MAQIIQTKSPVLAVVTDSMSYLKARKQAEELSQKHNLTVADMPLAIHAMTTQADIREAVRPKYLDAITAEVQGLRDGEKSYEAWHSTGSLATLKGLENAFKNHRGDYGFMTLDTNEWSTVGDGKYNGKNVARIHLSDAQKGDVPKPGTPYTVFVYMDKDKPTINSSGQLTYDQFMKDDRVLMITGSPDSREALAKMLFGAKKDGGEGRETIGSYHRINDVGFNEQTRGRLVYLDSNNFGLDGSSVIDSDGRFLGVSDGVASGEKSAAGATPGNTVIVHPTLEQTLSVINNPDLNREGMVKAMSDFYKE